MSANLCWGCYTGVTVGSYGLNFPLKSERVNSDSILKWNLETLFLFSNLLQQWSVPSTPAMLFYLENNKQLWGSDWILPVNTELKLQMLQVSCLLNPHSAPQRNSQKWQFVDDRSKPLLWPESRWLPLVSSHHSLQEKQKSENHTVIIPLYIDQTEAGFLRLRQLNATNAKRCNSTSTLEGGKC